MRTSSYSIFDFLKDCRGNWRNAVFIPCEACGKPCPNQRRGSLLTADAEGGPRAVCVSRFEAATGQRVEAPTASASSADPPLRRYSSLT